MNPRADAMNRAATARTKVLVIDDDERLNALLTKYMDRFGFSVRSAIDPRAALRSLKLDPPDIVILDIMLPEMDGFAVCRKVRETSCVPIIMLTARGDVMDRIVGLELGADDYLAKPFEPRELVARMQAVLRRGQRPESGDRLHIGALEVDWSTRTIRLEGQDLRVTTAEFELLSLLVRNPGKVLSRERILDGTRGIDWESFDRSVDVLVSRLRQKLGDDSKHPSFIRTIRGAGYVFIGGASA
ncbi:MAG TPA: response regulator transcription factor [Terracidiphilus sp.]|jgi:two-component system phosphate regulon response regulator OmpR